MLVLLLNSEINAIVIDCQFVVDGVYCCYGKVVDDYDNPAITEVLGEHVANRTAKDVQKLSIVRQGLTVFPESIEKFFPKVTRLDFSRNLLTNITNADIRGIPKLTSLELWGNRLTELESNLFEGMCHIKFLDIDFNRIEYVGYDFEFPESAMLFMRGNPCLNVTVVGALEVIRMKNLFRTRCPPVGAPRPIIPPEKFVIRPKYLQDHIILEDNPLSLPDRMAAFEERLSELETKMANAIEIRIKG